MNIKSTLTSTKSTTVNGIRVCLCGCQEHVAGKALYRPGHDARHVSITFAALFELGLSAFEGNVQESVLALFEQLGSEKLQQKLGRMVDNSKDGLYNAFGDAGVYVPFSTNPSLGDAERVYNNLFEVVQVLPVVEHEDTVKIGRWVYPARNIDGVFERNTKTDGSGEWIDA
jgi:hypothetical protein